MNSANISEEEMKMLIEKYSGENINKLFSTGLLSHPFAAAGPRQHMFSIHYTHHVMLDNPESPRNFTGWEKQFGKYLNSKYEAPSDYEIVAKIIRHSSFPQMSYLLVVREYGTNNYDTIQVSHYGKLSDQHGYIKPFTYVDEKGPGSIITKNDMVYKASSLDEFGNYRYGKNLKVAFMLIPEVKEDSVVISDEVANNTTFHLVTKSESVINKNDIMLNIYGNINEYKCIPNVGDYVNEKGILFATRKMDKKNISADFTDMALMNLYYTDNKFGANGQVVDIDIKVNDPEELKTDPHRAQLLELYNDQMRYNKEIVDVLGPIVKNQNNYVTDRLSQALFNAQNYISPNIKYSSNTGNFEFAHITIYTADKQTLTSAMKMTNRCGAKAVIGKVWPKENMPVDKNGVRADMICSSAGIIGRANPDQLFEQCINYISDEILRRMKKCKTTEDSINMLVEYLTLMSPEWGQYVGKYMKRLGKKEREEYLENLYNDPLGIYMYNPPANNAIGYAKLKDIARKYKITVSKVKMCRTYTVSEEVASVYDFKDNIEGVKETIDNFAFASKKNTKKKKEGKKTVTETIKTPYEVGVFEYDSAKDVKNPLKLSKDDYKENAWTDDYVWDTSVQIGVDDLDDEPPMLLSDYINTVQELEGVFDERTLNENHKHSTFDETKSKVYRKDKNVLVREFTSKYPIMIADVYEMLLKQMPNAAFSGRSLGSITPLGLPNKSMKKAEIGKPFGDTCNQMSDMDNNDLKNLVAPEKVARFYAVQSSHPELRAKCAEMLMTQDPTKLHDINIDDMDIKDTVPATILVSYLSSIGIEIGDSDEEDPYAFLDGVKYKSIPDLMSKVGIIPEKIG